MKTDTEHIASIIDYPLSKWVNHLLKTQMVEGDIVTGYYHYGDIVCDHCWIKMPDGRICDPTRWQFEDKPPYIYFGVPSDNYDEDGKRWEAELDRLYDNTFGKMNRQAKDLQKAFQLSAKEV